MITPAMFTFIVAAFCSFKDPKVSKEYKERCMEHLINCSFTGYNDGSHTTNKLVDECKTQWAEKHGL